MKLSDIWFYFLLVIFGIFALAALYLLRYHPLTQFFVVITLSTFYFLLGVLYHFLKKDLTKQVVFEFLGIAVFAVLSFGILTFWRII